MQYNVAQLMKQPTGATRVYQIQSNIDQLDPEIVAVDELSGELLAMRTIDGVLMTGILTTIVELSCDRCLRPFACPLELTLEDEFRPTIDIATGASLPVVAGDNGNRIDEFHILDVSEVVRQQILVTSPLHPLCRDDCRGLCMTCGQDLNESDCDCIEEELDPRWGALRTLLK